MQFIHLPHPHRISCVNRYFLLIRIKVDDNPCSYLDNFIPYPFLR